MDLKFDDSVMVKDFGYGEIAIVYDDCVYVWVCNRMMCIKVPRKDVSLIEVSPVERHDVCINGVSVASRLIPALQAMTKIPVVTIASHLADDFRWLDYNGLVSEANRLDNFQLTQAGRDWVAAYESQVAITTTAK